jgi:competence protein ComEC
MVNRIIVPVIIAVVLAGGGSAYYYGGDVSDDEEPTFIFMNEGVPEGPQLQLHFIDVGQGDSTLIITPSGQTMLIDGGNNGKGDDVFDYLQSIDVNQIDFMIATHPDADHIGGLDEIMELINVTTVYDNGQEHETITYSDYISLARERDYQIVREDFVLNLDDDATLEFIVPYDTDRGLYSDTNANSILIRASFQGVSALFTGDCEKKCERDVMKDDTNSSIGNNIKAKILKAGHHGSKTSSGESFVTEINPELALISVGKNSWGHPNKEVLKIFNDKEMDVFRTDKHGNIVIIIDSDGNTWLSHSKN